MVELVNPEGLARPIGYSHGAVGRGRMLALAGQIGWDKRGQLVSTDFAPQFEQALKNLKTVIEAAGGTTRDLVSLRIYVTDKRRYLAATKEVGRTYRALLGDHYPAMALVQVADLLEEGALVEIEGLAVIADEAMPASLPQAVR
jgi:enamine deaminase RidA (YjgF/YER057c/UK114 family)